MIAEKNIGLENKPFILNIESATSTCSVSLCHGLDLLVLEEAEEPFQHAKILTTLIDKSLKNNGLLLRDLGAVALSSGPGSYTSLRVGASVAKGICYALEKPLIRVDTLQALALSASQEVGNKHAIYCPMIDARRMEVYCGLYDSQGNLVGEIMAKVVEAGAFEEYFKEGTSIVFCGNGADKCRHTITSPLAIFHPSECSAAFMPILSWNKFINKKFENIAYFTPCYLKPPNITAPKKARLFEY